ncbi:hypothetical protein KLAE6086_05550 [Klebsiella aerogenes]
MSFITLRTGGCRAVIFDNKSSLPDCQCRTIRDSGYSRSKGAPFGERNLWLLPFLQHRF